MEYKDEIEKINLKRKSLKEQDEKLNKKQAELAFKHAKEIINLKKGKYYRFDEDNGDGVKCTGYFKYENCKYVDNRLEIPKLIIHYDGDKWNQYIILKSGFLIVAENVINGQVIVSEINESEYNEFLNKVVNEVQE